MALVSKDRVKETTTTTGVGAWTLGGNVTGFRKFSDVLANGDTFYYGAWDGNLNWETGIGTFSLGFNSITRTTILDSSNGGAAVNFTIAPTVWIDAPASKVPLLDANGHLGVGTAPGAGSMLAVVHNAGTTGFIDVTNTASGGKHWQIGDGTGAGTGQFGFYNATNTTLVLLLDGLGAVTVGTDLKANGVVLAGTSTGIGGTASNFWTAGGNVNPAAFRHTHASTPVGIYINYSAAAPNDAGHEFILCVDSSATRATIRSNGGLANFSANNVNLSDELWKTDIEPITGTLEQQLWDAHKAIDWSRFKLKDQTHGDWNFGYTAGGARRAFDGIAPGLVETDESGFPYQRVYHHDITNISGAVTSMLQRRMEAVEARLAAAGL